jgi:hypothetical protein
MKHATSIILLGIGTLMLTGSARAGNLSNDSPFQPTGDIFANPAGEVSSQNWVPYESQFTEISGYLRNRIGSRIPYAVRQQVDSASEMNGQSEATVPGHLPISWVKRDYQEDDCQEGSMGTPSTSSVERPTTPPAALGELSQTRDLELQVFFANESKSSVIPSTVSRLFRPPRP